MKILDTISEECKSPMFPIIINMADTDNPIVINPDETISIDTSNYDKSIEKSYVIWQSKNLNTTKIWDKERAVYAEIYLADSQGRRSFNVKFKGIEVTKNFFVPYHAVNITIDLFGLEAKDTITLNRSSLTDNGKKAVCGICDELIQLFCNETLRKLENIADSFSKNRDFKGYSFWTVCSPNQRLQIPAQVIKSISNMTTILQKKQDGRFEQTDKEISEIIANIDEYAFLYPHYLNSIDPETNLRLKKVTEELNALEVNESSIVLDDNITEAALQFHIRFTKGFRDSRIFIYKVAKDASYSSTPMDALDEETEILLLNGLNSVIKGYGINGFYSDGAKRYAIPAFEKYRELSVKNVPFNIVLNCLNKTIPYIISPFTKEQADNALKQSKDMFIDEMTSLTAFDNLVKYVHDNSYFNEPPSLDVIKEKYISLAENFYDCIKGKTNEE